MWEVVPWEYAGSLVRYTVQALVSIALGAELSLEIVQLGFEIVQGSG